MKWDEEELSGIIISSQINILHPSLATRRSQVHRRLLSSSLISLMLRKFK